MPWIDILLWLILIGAACFMLASCFSSNDPR